jgi:hypothetical protein
MLVPHAKFPEEVAFLGADVAPELLPVFAPDCFCCLGASCGFCPWISKVWAADEHVNMEHVKSAQAEKSAKQERGRTLTRDREIFTLDFFTALIKTGLDSGGGTEGNARIQQL